MHFSKCIVFGRVAANHRHVIRKRNCSKIPDCYWYLYLHVTLFRMHVEIQRQIKIWYWNTHDTEARSSSEIQENKNGWKR